ncbi:MAG: small ribosomal subunit Rsm22 family protein [Spirochaetaceae bacterium]|jgi:hypothetical protein|nr:small ribosomal subunit Rsm22 family protein [Spirochaetaceae bacterium]
MNSRNTRKTGAALPQKRVEQQRAADRTPHSKAEPGDIRQAPPEISSTLFSTPPKDTLKYLEEFGAIVQGVLPLSGKQRKELPHIIRDLSRQMTDERSRRRAGYMNETGLLSAYIRYFMWWNLIRLVPIFAGLAGFAPEDGSVMLDIGSGPLTVPAALWLARPELRKRNLTWYCLDQSQTALAAGENIFLALAARTGGEPWKILRVKGGPGTEIRRKADFITCANMFNELYWDSREPLEALVKKYSAGLLAYADESARVFIAEPGIPQGGRFMTLMRDSLIRKGYGIAAPCPHEGECSMPGKRFGTSSGGKWCHFTFPAENAPKTLRKLSEEAGLTKERAAISLLFAVKMNGEKSVPDGDTAVPDTEKTLPVRIVSDLIFLGGEKAGTPADGDRARGAGRYGCSALGLTLAGGAGKAGYTAGMLKSGDLIEVPLPDKNAPKDAKTGAILVQPVTGETEVSGENAPRSPRPSRGQSRSSGRYRR